MLWKPGKALATRTTRPHTDFTLLYDLTAINRIVLPHTLTMAVGRVTKMSVHFGILLPLLNQHMDIITSRSDVIWRRTNYDGFQINTACLRSPTATLTMKQLEHRISHLDSRPRRKHFLSSRLKYYPAIETNFQLTRIVISGDINPNPGPECYVCKRTIARNHRFLNCCECKLQCHIKCVHVTPNQFKWIRTQNTTWSCFACAWKILPFDCSSLSGSEGQLKEWNHNSLMATASDIEEQQDPLQDLVSIRKTYL